MRFVTQLSVWLTALLISQAAFSQSNRIKYNNQELFLSGANLAWVNFAADIGRGDPDLNRFADVMLAMHDSGGNALRWWVHTNGTVSPIFNTENIVTGPGANTISDLKKVLDLAWEREIGLKLCLWSFDMLRKLNSTVVKNRNKLLLTDTNYTRAYINNCLIPMVDSLKGHPAIIAWEIFNEPEGMSNEFGWPEIEHVSMLDIQRFINLCAGAIHRTDPTALVTNGAWSFKALTNVPIPVGKISAELSQLSLAEKKEMEIRFEQKYRMSLTADEIIQHMQRVESQPNFNYYSDSRLIAAGGDPDGILDFYSVHYYDWGGTAISPFHHSASRWGLDKPIVVAEFAMKDTYGVLKQDLFKKLFQSGYAGALAWSWTDSQFSSPEDMLAAMQYMWDNYRNAVDVIGIGGDWPIVTITSPKSDTTFPDGAEVTIVAEASDNDGHIVLVEFFVSGNIKIGEVTAAPYTIIWQNITPNIYTLTAVATDNQDHKRTSNRVVITVGTPPMVRLEAEAATRVGTGMSVKSDNTASNNAFVDIASQSGTITWTLANVQIAGNYDIAFGYKLFYDRPKSQYINVNGTRVCTLVFDGASTISWYENTTAVDLIQGNNTIQMELYWGWMYLDYLAVPSIIFTSVESSPEHPVVFSLQQNYPNPFNSVTTISYSIAQSNHVKLVVYDILGRRVMTLINEYQDAGVYSLPFDGGTLHSGVYFYRIEAGTFTQTKKMIIAK